jgi:signal transduction histidine kinase
VPLAWRRVAPGPVALAATAALAVDELTGGPLINSALVFVPLFLATYSISAYTTGRGTAVWGSVLFVLFVAVAAIEDGDVGSSLMFVALVLFTPPFLAGLVVRSRARLGEQLADRAADLEREREARAELAVVEERTRLAGELHDIVAQGVAAMLAQVAEARRLVSAGSPAAPDAIGAIEETGRDALGELRRLLGVLRRGDEDLALAPHPSLEHVDALADHLRAAGRVVTVRVEGDPVRLTPGLDVAAYRIVEEALAASAPDAGTSEVVVRWAPGRIAVEVGSIGPSLAEGAAVAGLRERVELFGGDLRSGRRPRGGSAVLAELPMLGGAG